MIDKLCFTCNQKVQMDMFGSMHIQVKCPTCGNYIVLAFENGVISHYDGDLNKLASYLYYNNHDSESSICFIGSLDGYKNIVSEISQCKYVTPDLVESWYPPNFNEQVDMFLIAVYDKSETRSEYTTFSWHDIISATLVNRRNRNGYFMRERTNENDALYMLNYLRNEGYIELLTQNTNVPVKLCLLPKGYTRIDEDQKNLKTNSKNVFIAMSFAEEMKNVRETIKSAITECGFFPVLIDEIEHNKQIVPEMLNKIKKSKFIIAELTGHNNGAYFEAGYALGCGKEVIQLCKRETFGADGHFDVKQINTVLWKTETDLKEKLIKRIRATVM